MKKTICAVTAAMLALTSVLCGCSSNGESSSQSGSTTPATVATDTTVKTTGEKIHINDSTLGEIWITELDGVPKNTLNNDNFTSDDTFKYYSENGKAASMEGIDISSYSGKIDWNKVKKSGVDFVMVRIGGRGYGSDGKMYSDDSALSYIKGAKADLKSACISSLRLSITMRQLKRLIILSHFSVMKQLIFPLHMTGKSSRMMTQEPTAFPPHRLQPVQRHSATV